MSFRVWSFNPATLQQQGYTLVAEFESEESAMAYVNEKHEELGELYRVEKHAPPYDQIIFEHSYEKESEQ